MNKKTKALTTEQYKEIIQTMREGFSGCRPNERIATALVLEGNLGLQISDILKLRLCDIVRDGDRYRLEIVEQKTGKRRIFTVPLVLYQYIENYCLRNGVSRTDIFSPLQNARYRSNCISSATTWVTRESALIASASSGRQRYIS